MAMQFNSLLMLGLAAASAICAADTTAATAEEICQMPSESGPCEALVPSYYFDWTIQQCQYFEYGGCKGNANRFSGEDDCMDFCNYPYSTTEEPRNFTSQTADLVELVSSNVVTYGSDNKTLVLIQKDPNQSSDTASVDGEAAEELFDSEPASSWQDWEFDNLANTISQDYANDTEWTVGENSTSELGQFVITCQLRKNCTAMKTMYVVPSSMIEVEFSLYIKGWLENPSTRDTNPRFVLTVVASAENASLATTSPLKIFDVAEAMEVLPARAEAIWRRCRLVLHVRGQPKAEGGISMRLLLEVANGRRSSGPSEKRVAVDNINLVWRTPRAPKTAVVTTASAGGKGREKQPHNNDKEAIQIIEIDF